MRFLPSILTRNWLLKLVAFILAVLLWAVVRVEVQDRRVVTGIPVQVTVNDEDWLLAADPTPAQVDVGFLGPTGGLLRLASEPPSVEISVDAIEGSDTLLAISRENLRFPDDAGLTVESIEPASVQITLERKLSLRFPFQVGTIGSPNPTLALAQLPMAAPSHGRVQGPASQVGQLQRIPLHPVDLSVLTGSGSVTTTIDAEAMEGFSVTPAEVQVEIRLETAVDRSFETVPVVVEGTSGLAADPAAVGVTIHGAASLVEAIDPADLLVLVRDPPLPVADTGVVLPIVIQGVPSLVRATATQGTVRVLPLGSIGSGL